LKQAISDNFKSAAELPYFEGDFWPNVLEESIKELDEEEEKKVEVPATTPSEVNPEEDDSMDVSIDVSRAVIT